MPARARNVLFSKTSGPALEFTQPLISEYWGYFRGYSGRGHKTKHSSPSNAEFKNKWKNISLSLVNIHGLDGDTFTFFFTTG
jgi:hypothetical protein